MKAKAQKYFTFSLLILGLLSTNHLLYPRLLANESQTNTATSTPATSQDQGKGSCLPAIFANLEVINDPIKLPFLEWIRVRKIEDVAPRIQEAKNFYVDTRDFPLSADNLLATYRSGGKLYQHFDRIDLGTGQVEPHRWEFPAFRGVNNISEVKNVMSKSSFISKIHKTIYPYRFPHPTQKRQMVSDQTKPVYEIRINHNPDLVIAQCAQSERLSQDTTTKEKRRDADGHTLLTKATWLSKEVQDTLSELVKRGNAYTIGVYTTEHHRKEIEDRSTGGRLVAGAIGLVIDGVYTGVSLFMDRSHVPEKKSDLYYDWTGRLAFFAELDMMEALGVKWVDSVTVNQAARDFGGQFYTRDEFQRMLEETHAAPIEFKKPENGRWNIRFDRWNKDTLLNEIAFSEYP